MVVAEDAPVIVIVPALLVENEYWGVVSVVGVDTGVTSVICGKVVSIVNCGTVNVLDSYPKLSVTLIVILLYVPSDKALKVNVLLPTVAFVVDEVAPVIVIVPASLLLKV